MLNLNVKYLSIWACSKQSILVCVWGVLGAALVVQSNTSMNLRYCSFTHLGCNSLSSKSSPVLPDCGRVGVQGGTQHRAGLLDHFVKALPVSSCDAVAPADHSIAANGWCHNRVRKGPQVWGLHIKGPESSQQVESAVAFLVKWCLSRLVKYLLLSWTPRYLLGGTCRNPPPALWSSLDKSGGGSTGVFAAGVTGKGEGQVNDQFYWSVCSGHSAQPGSQVPWGQRWF